MASRHLVAYLQLALDGDEDLDHLDHPRRQIVSAGDAADLVLEAHLEGVHLSRCARDDAARLALQLRVLQLQVRQEGEGDALQQLLRQRITLGDQHLPVLIGQPRAGAAAHQQLLQARDRVLLNDADLIVLVLAEARHFLALDELGTFVLGHALAREDAHVDDRALDPGRNLEGRVPHLARLLAEDGAQQLLLGRELGLPLGSDLAHEHVAGLDLRADADHPALVEVLEGLVARVGNVPGDLLRPQLRVPGDALELLDVHRSVDVLLDHALADQDGVLEVVAAPGHQRHEEIPSQGELSDLRGRPVRDHVPFADVIAHANDGALVDARVLVGALVLDQTVDVHPGVGIGAGWRVRLDDDARGVDALDDTVALGHHGGA